MIFKKAIRAQSFIALSCVLSAFCCPSNVMAEQPSEPLLTRRAFLATDNSDVLDPLDITSLKDGSLIVVGSTGRAAWAMGVDAQGRRTWTTIRSINGAPRDLSGTAQPAYKSVAVLEDETAVICGALVSTDNLNALMPVLTRINTRDGRILKEDQLRLSDVNAIPDLLKCVAYKDGYLVFGQSGFSGPPSQVSARPYEPHTFHMLYFTRNNELVWHTSIKILQDAFTLISAGVSLELTTFGSVVAVTNNRSTEILSFSHAGQLMGHVALDGRFLVVHNLLAQESVELHGSNAGPNEPLTFISLSQDLKQIRQQLGKVPSSFAPVAVYRAREQGPLTIFGERIYHKGQAVLEVSSDLTAQSELKLDTGDMQLANGGTISGVGWAIDSQLFSSVRSGFVKSDDRALDGSNGPFGGWRRGVIVESVRTR